MRRLILLSALALFGCNEPSAGKPATIIDGPAYYYANVSWQAPNEITEAPVSDYQIYVYSNDNQLIAQYQTDADTLSQRLGPLVEGHYKVAVRAQAIVDNQIVLSDESLALSVYLGES